MNCSLGTIINQQRRICPVQNRSPFLYELVRRPIKPSPQLYCCKSPEHTFQYLKEIGLPYQTQEYMLTLLLDSRNQIAGHYVVSKGLLDRAHIHPREVYRIALMNGTSKIILAHNHPSGDPEPSRQDIISTENIAEAGNIIGVPLIDHIVVGHEKYVSMREEGLM